MHSIRFGFLFSFVAHSLAGLLQFDGFHTKMGVRHVTNTRTVYTTICPVTPSCLPVTPASEIASYLQVSSVQSEFSAEVATWGPIWTLNYETSSSWAATITPLTPQPISSDFPECWNTCFAKNGISGEVYLCGNKAVTSCVCDTCSPANDKAYKAWLDNFCTTHPSPSQSSSSAAPVYESSSISAPPVYGSSSSAVPSISSSTSSSASASSLAGPRPSCPAIWSTIVDEMKQVFGGCTEPARQSIRFAFHDAGEAFPYLKPCRMSLIHVDSWLSKFDHALWPSKRWR
jgi:hypothetical protein